MAFRTIDISSPAELHVQQRQLIIMQESGTVHIPLDDIFYITCSGPSIRISTLALSKLNEQGITVLTIDEKYNASSISVPVKGYSRQAMVIHSQIAYIDSMEARLLWMEIIRQKISNQRAVLRLLEIKEAETLGKFILKLDLHNVEECEALAAKKYFQLLCPGLNRREECPLNSKLNYGYAVLRNAIIRSLINKGFQPAIGLHHANQLNAFNLADDLIEPFRPIVDFTAISIEENTLLLSKESRSKLANVLHCSCKVNGHKEKVIHAIEQMTESLRTCMLGKTDVQKGTNNLLLPTLLPSEVMNKLEE